jgi:antitoxin (DNA-binding transcriptional repressor) of toxin-antitoxin stability system
MNDTITIIKSRDLRDNMQQVADAVAKGRSFLVMKQSKPLFRITKAHKIDEWGDEILPGDVNFDFRDRKHPNGVPMDEFLRKLRDFNAKEAKNGR